MAFFGGILRLGSRYVSLLFVKEIIIIENSSGGEEVAQRRLFSMMAVHRNGVDRLSPLGR